MSLTVALFSVGNRPRRTEVGARSLVPFYSPAIRLGRGSGESPFLLGA